MQKAVATNSLSINDAQELTKQFTKIISQYDNVDAVILASTELAILADGSSKIHFIDPIEC